jgi:hypothetical protein
MVDTMTVNLQGQVTSSGTPVPGVMIRLISDETTLGADPHAASDSRGTVGWTRAISGVSGSLWNVWQKYAVRDVAGLTWEEFRVEALQYNPALRLTDEVFQPDQTYFLPENRIYSDTRSAAPTVTWERGLTGFSGSRWDCWRRYVQGKVSGLTWAQFREEVMAYNPQLAAEGGRFRGDAAYLLPRSVGLTAYKRVAYAGVDGQFAFVELPPGAYRVEIAVDGFERLVRQIVVGADTEITFELEPILVVVERDGVPFVRCHGRHFAIGGQSFRFVGVNLRGLVHYGTEILPGANAKDQLEAARNIGAKVIRVFLPHRSLSVDQIKARLANTIAMLKRDFPEMYLIVALTNLYGDVDFKVPGDSGFGPEGKGFYTLRAGDHDLLGLEWFRTGYTKNYLPFVRSVVETFKNEPTIMAWNVGNELKAEGDPEMLVRFMHDAARKIKQWDPNHLVTTGMISTRHAWMHTSGNEHWQKTLYDVPWLDFVTNHTYHGDDDNATNLDQENDANSREDDSGLAQSLNKPLLIEEAGFKPTESRRNRRDWYAKELAVLLDERQASGYMPWGFMAGSDNGDGDNDLGIDESVHREDWNDLRDLLRGRAFGWGAQSVALGDPPVKISSGKTAFAAAGLRLRNIAGLKSVIIETVRTRTQVEVLGGPQAADGLNWWQVRLSLADGRLAQGWMAQTDAHGQVLLSGV